LQYNYSIAHKTRQKGWPQLPLEKYKETKRDCFGTSCLAMTKKVGRLAMIDGEGNTGIAMSCCRTVAL
ncbi:MAG: hypothetical protein ACK415_12435, partial [Thermodesulfovibrionales bacterium]